MKTLEEISMAIEHGPFSLTLSKQIKYGIESYRRDKGLRSGGEAARELLALALTNAALEA